MEYPTDKPYNITISIGTIIKAIITIILIYTLFLIKDVVLVVISAVVLASALEPAIRWFQRRKFNRVFSAVSVYILTLFAIASIMIFFIPRVLDDASLYLNKLPNTISVNDLWSPIRDIGIWGDSTTIKDLGSDYSIKDLSNQFSQIISGSGEGFFKTAGAIFGGALSLILIIVLSFYLAVQEDGVRGFLEVMSPKRYRDYVVDLWKRSQSKIGLWMQGQLILAVMVGVLVFLGLMVLGVNHALLLAVLAAIFEIIPVFGPILSAIPAILVGTVDGGATGTLLVLGLYVLIHQFENHLLYPLVVRKVVGISPVIVILALIVGAKLAGFLGLLLSVPIATVIMELYSDIEKRRKSIT